MGLNHGWRGPNIVKDGLVLYLDAGSPNSYQGTGTIWKDISKVNQNNGTLINGPTFSSANGGSIVFDGVDDFVEVPNFNTVNTITVDVWVKKTSGNSWQGWLGNWNTTGNGDSWLLTQNNSNRASFYIMHTNNVGDNIVDTSGIIVGNVWYNYTGTFSNSTLSLYKNGSLVNSKSTLQNTIYQNSLKIWCGRFSTFYLNGQLSNGKVYNRALSADEVLQNYNATKGRFGL
jgi:hypothetical protein